MLKEKFTLVLLCQPQISHSLPGTEPGHQWRQTVNLLFEPWYGWFCVCVCKGSSMVVITLHSDMDKTGRFLLKVWVLHM